MYDLGKAIEKKRIPADRGIVHSYRFGPDTDGQFYDQQYGWESFRQQSLEEIKSDKYDAVVVAYIADFFHHVYSHPLENALTECTKQKAWCARAIKGLLKQWNHTISYGLPVGPSASRLLSELALTVVDDRLVSDGIQYCRFSDDYRLFCTDQRQAYGRLAMFAQVLFDTLGLTLHQHKTKILSKHEAAETFLTPKRKERARLSQQFRTILTALGITDPYKKIDYARLSSGIKAQVDALNLEAVLEEQITLGDSMDVLLTSFVLNRLAQLENQSPIELVMKSLDVLYPVFRDVVKYVSSAAINLHANTRKALGAKLLGLLDEAVPGHLEYHRCWVLNVFAESDKWDNEARLAKLKPTDWSESFSRRELILARGRARHESWFKAEKLNIDNLPPWERRAFLYAASCLPGDEPKHWWEGLKKSGKLDPLDRAVIAYAKQHPIVE